MASYAAIIAIILILAFLFAICSGKDFLTGKDTYCGSVYDMGPYNIQLYDRPYYYPRWEGNHNLWWDTNARCAAYCTQSPCVVWCR